MYMKHEAWTHSKKRNQGIMWQINFQFIYSVHLNKIIVSTIPLEGK